MRGLRCFIVVEQMITLYIEWRKLVDKPWRVYKTSHVYLKRSVDVVPCTQDNAKLSQSRRQRQGKYHLKININAYFAITPSRSHCTILAKYATTGL